MNARRSQHTRRAWRFPLAPRRLLASTVWAGTLAAVLNLTAFGCAVDDRFVDSTRGEDYGGTSSGGHTSGGKTSSDGGTSDGGAATGSSTSTGAAPSTGGANASGGGSGGAGTGGAGDGGAGDGGAGDGGAGDGGAGTGGTGGTGFEECQAPGPALSFTEDSYIDNGTICGYAFAFAWEGATTNPPCGTKACFSGGNICLDLSAPAPDPDGTNSMGTLGVYPGGAIAFNLMQLPGGDATSVPIISGAVMANWTLTASTAPTMQLSIMSGTTEYCVIDPEPGVFYHFSDFTVDCWSQDPTSARLAPGTMVDQMAIHASPREGAGIEVTDFCLLDVQVRTSLEDDCRTTCQSVSALSCFSWASVEDCIATCTADPTDGYCKVEQEALASCEASLPPTGFDCSNAELSWGPDYTCEDEATASAYCCIYSGATCY